MRGMRSHLMPVVDRDPTVEDRYTFAWGMVLNFHFDPHRITSFAIARSTRLSWRRNRASTVFASMKFTTRPRPDAIAWVSATVLSRRIKTAKIANLSNAFCLRDDPLKRANNTR